MSKEYNSDSIIQLEGLEPVRLRPGMYIGSVDSRGLHHLIWELVDNSIDEAMGHHATQIVVKIHKDGSFSVKDNGRGIPVGMNSKTKKSAVEMVFSELHAGGKFNNDSYSVSGGLHGVGASVVNALSSWLEVNVWINSKKHNVRFENGGTKTFPLKEVPNTENIKSGTEVSFYPDFSIMEKHDWDETIITTRLKQLAYLNKGLEIVFINEMNETEKIYKNDGGLKNWINELNSKKEPLVPNVVYGEIEKKIRIQARQADMNVSVEVAFQYNKTYNMSIFSFCNNINTTEGGCHEDGFKFAVQKIINKYAVNKKYLKDKDDKISKEDVCEGLTAIISIKHPNPIYEGQTKRKLGGNDIRPTVSDLTQEIFEKYLVENPDEADLIIKKCMLAKEARKKSQEVREATRRKSPFESNSLPGKLADCSTKDQDISEIYIVEGDSAGGSAKIGRDRIFQAILPLKGKIINVEKAQTSTIFNNNEIIDLITAIGAGVGNDFNIEKLRYNKIIIMTDADVDGSHIRILLLTFFFRYMLPLIERGNVFIAQPPLYKFSAGKNVQYAYDEATMTELKETHKNQKFNIQRYKGLGEMNPNQLWETTMDPKNRLLLKVSIEDAIAADQKFSELMGDDVKPRKEFIEANARYVKNLDT
ncbi:MAG: DNA topoisomerase (ATP-hydrolyzing) subunit B [Mycoplasmoidaceae bacterium]